ncbi:chitosanase [Nostoc sp. WHI]|uniref:chitosanase n=1 Tax=Nostoc sp. WHI TaxID=2650611 RepID=UPI0018C6BD75|nr:peptidoglycan-binding protein [Nostoc sp. WHI]MBG1266844.1 chitosanase [Nostoc sp. WHI]
MLTEIQKKAAQAIINIFETGSVSGKYDSVVSVAGDPGGLTYGAKQTTINSGNLHLLIKAYVEAEGALFADELRPYLSSLKNREQRLNRDTTLHSILRQAGRDSVMIQEQDAFFDRVYWTPALNSAAAINIQTVLGIAVVFDSITHGSWRLIRDRTTNQFGNPSSVGEKAWLKHYVDVRRNWLANHSIQILHLTVYRMDSFKRIIQTDNWDLSLPFTVRGLIISEDTLSPTIPSPGIPGNRLLSLTRPPMTGADVREVQQALIAKGFNLGENGADGIFGPMTDAVIRAFQEQQNLRVDGIVGRASRSALELDD